MGDNQDILFPSDPRVFISEEHKAVVKKLIEQNVAVPSAYHSIYYILHVPESELDLDVFKYLIQGLDEEQMEQYFGIDGDLWSLNSLLLCFEGPKKKEMWKIAGWST